ncbi:MAG: gliding motility-associated C-terminal domain-containing protein [Haliscomenobacter sp.]|nr:gliding motility-associated C-terminal domain-containing protein [Haliscomenobacter sp.]MBK9490230.1 gliding motility-associated C-terminal domain-containing protein [Haliscomenobacter sp.]
MVFTQDEPALLIGKNVSDNLPWTIEGLEAFPNHKITVLNRWGEEVFTITGGYTNNWHGTFKDKKLPQGTYYYQIDTGETGKKPILGSLYVIR